MVRCSTCNVFHMRQLCRFFWWNRYFQNHRRILPNFLLFVWFHTVKFNPLPCSNDKMYDDVVLADQFRYPLTVWYSCIDRVISTPSCSYCIWNRYFQNHRRILPNFLLLVWFNTVEFNRLRYPNDKMYDAVIFGNRFWYQLTMFEDWILIGLSWLLNTQILILIVGGDQSWLKN